MNIFSTILSLLLAFAGISCATDFTYEQLGSCTLNASHVNHFCAHTWDPFYTKYILRGRRWPFEERDIHRAVKRTSGCLMTSWKYRDWQEDGLNNFDATVSSFEKLPERACLRC
jgi:hypothetical protein